MNDTEFEIFPLHAVVDTVPIAPDNIVVLPSAGLRTETVTVPDFTMSAAVMTAVSWWVLTKVVGTKEPFQFTTELSRKSLPLTIRRNWLPPAVPLAGEMEETEGKGGQLPQESALTSVVARTAKIDDLAAPAIG